MKNNPRRFMEETLYTMDHYAFLGGEDEFLPGRSLRYNSSESSAYLHIKPPSNFIALNHIIDSEIRLKYKHFFEKNPLNSNNPQGILDLLVEVSCFENSLHKSFPGAKRFSIEGLDSLIPGLEEIIQMAPAFGINNIIMGMPHRGRLDVLACVFKKPYSSIVSEFQESYEGPSSLSGDVKYHNGYSAQRDNLTLTLLPNPSHLESIGSVTLGYAKGLKTSCLPIVMHGDASFSGQGVVYETFQLGGLDGYSVDGTIHIVMDNQIGFTATEKEGRSTPYCSDLAKAFNLPIFHVNADDPDSVCVFFKMALLFRQTFQKDSVIHLIGYRRHGHNEGDEPAFTNPLMYQKIKMHLPVATLYAQKHNLIIDETPYALPSSSPTPIAPPLLETKQLLPLSIKQLNSFLSILYKVPSHFNLHPKMKKLFEERLISPYCDWATAEALAFMSYVHDGRSVRLSGQDSQRGTFSHRHAVWIDQKTGEKHCPFGEGFEVFNSPLSEYAVLGFEYGYSLSHPHDLVIWEAQFGDFANGAQIIIDQYLSASFMKWGQESHLVLMLPHGYEGQGPEHSSARLERFLQLSAQNNWIIANVTTPSNLYHILRKQRQCPLILMTPKSLLRHKDAISSWEDFLDSFKPLYQDTKIAKRAIFCSGKVYYDLVKAKQNQDISLIRLEQLYPFPIQEISAILGGYQEYVWCQEEPKNMGAWAYIKPFFEELGISIQYVGRSASSAPATGYHARHQREQKELVAKALSI